MIHLNIPLPYIEIFSGKSGSKKKFHSNFLYENFPTRWRENWRKISGFGLTGFGRYLTVCVWRQRGVYTDRQHRDVA